MSTPTVLLAARGPFVQRAVVAIFLALLAWRIAGLIANPDFATGGQATAEQVLFVGFNGWHASRGSRWRRAACWLGYPPVGLGRIAWP